MLTGMELKIERIKNRIKAVKLASELGVTPSFISLVENGKCNVPFDKYDKWITYIRNK